MNKLFSVLIAAFVFTIFSCTADEVGVVENYTNESVEEMCSRSRVGDKGCFEFIFPITVNFADGSTKDVVSYDSLRAAVKAFKIANKDVKERPTIAFPYAVTTSDGTVVNVENAEQQKALLATCKPKGKDHPGKGKGDGKPCFNLTYPFSITTPTGVVVIANKEELKVALKKAGKDKKIPAFVFPITVVLKDGTTKIVNSKEELHALKEACRK